MLCPSLPNPIKRPLEILNEIVDRSPGVGWDAIAGLQVRKSDMHVLAYC